MCIHKLHLCIIIYVHVHVQVSMYTSSTHYTHLSIRSQTSMFPFTFVMKNTPGLVGDQAPPVRGTNELEDLINASL